MKQKRQEKIKTARDQQEVQRALELIEKTAREAIVQDRLAGDGTIVYNVS
jgi:hypothetical protein